jgi:hypothetical protein
MWTGKRFNPTSAMDAPAIRKSLAPAPCRDDNDAGRFGDVLAAISRKRLTYGELIGQDTVEAPII